MNAFGVDTTSLVTGAALIGLAFAFAVQQIMGDFVAGLFLLIEDQFNKGDLVEINGILGHVEKMSLRCTSIRQENGVLSTFPNGDIRHVDNWNRNYNYAMISIGITYETAINDARKCLEGPVAEALMKDDEISKEILERPFFDGVDELADSAVVLQYMIKCKAGQKLEVERVAMELVKTIFDAHGVDLAYPRVNIGIVGGASKAAIDKLPLLAGEIQDKVIQEVPIEE